jgi:2-oxoglutarate dehydrogenase E1 component
MTSTPIIGVYNDGHVAEMYEAFRRDPASVDESWRQYFSFAESIGGGATAPTAASPAVDPGFLRMVAGAAALIDAIRQYGHLAVPIDPLGSAPAGASELTPEFHGIVEADLGLVPAEALGYPGEGTAADVAARLRRQWAGRVGYEVGHIEDDLERGWLRQAIDEGTYALPLGSDEQVALLRRLTEVDGLERFLGRAYSTAKRFSIEGTDMMVPMLDAAVEASAALGAQEVVIGMAHRGRLNTLVHLMDKPYAKLFDEFDGKHDHHDNATGDVKYHLGAATERTCANGRQVRLSLVPNPSHLEVVNPVLAGVARARRDLIGGGDELVLPIVIHGDAAFPGEGVVAESFNMSRLPGYRVGGSLHIISNNQVGFTTNPSDSRSTYYASDLAKGFEVPIVHVNADDPTSCIGAIRLAIAYRAKFGKDVLIDLVGYRRWGHNEGDEPSFTQPTLYATIRQHPTVRQLWGEHLVAQGVLSADAVARMDAEFQSRMDEVLTQARREPATEGSHPVATHSLDLRKLTPSFLPPVDTGVSAEVLIQLNERLLHWPTSHAVHPRLAKQLERRREALGAAGGIDWGHAESLAFASLLAEGVDVRLTGQDAERGTFSHRHSVLTDVNTGAKHAPLQHLPGAPGRFEIHNSPLTELAVLAFEYGYSTAALDALVLWEAQFGDFVNMAAPIIDQFIAADRAKWGQDSGVALLLPHGYEGQGPEHSSARLERFLQLCAEGNLRVAYPSTAAQYFHVLRRQARLQVKRPLVLMQPKSMLRLQAASARLEDLTSGRFFPVLDDPAVTNRDDVTRLVFCTGKVYYDLVTKEHPSHLAVVRVEQLYPWPNEDVAQVVDLYPNIAEIVWAQEEPKNMGAWSYVAPRLRASAGNALIIRYIGRPERASPAEGYLSSHNEEQARIVNDVHAAPLVPRSRPPALR